MIRPYEMSLDLPMKVADEQLSTTDDVWDILDASYRGDTERVQALVQKCPALIYAQYNYAPPIHFAVREGHVDLVGYLLDKGAYSPAYRSYPFGDDLETFAADRGHDQILAMLKDYRTNPPQQYYSKDNGEIFYQRTDLQKRFEQVVDAGNLSETEKILKEHPEFALDQTYFWSEGILTFAAKENDQAMMDLLTSYGATVPKILKWTPAYYFERLDGATYIMQKGMDPNTKSWHHVTVLHNMAQQGDIAKAELLLKHGADINAIDEEYRSTPLGMAARWGKLEMVDYLLNHSADPLLAGAAWATPLAWAISRGYKDIEERLRAVL